MERDQHRNGGRGFHRAERRRILGQPKLCGPNALLWITVLLFPQLRASQRRFCFRDVDQF